MNAQIERAVEHFRALLEEQLARVGRMENFPSQAQAAKASNDAKVESEMQIAQKLNDLSIRKAELKVQEDTKKAEADAAYTIQQQYHPT